MKEVIHVNHRNKVFLIQYTEYVYRLLKKKKGGHYSMQEIVEIVDGYSDLKKLNWYFDKFSILFADYCANQPWDQTSASLGIDDNGQNIAKSTIQILDRFKEMSAITRTIK